MDLLEVFGCELPFLKDPFVWSEVVYVVDLLVSAEGNIEFPRPVEPAKSVVACPVKIVEYFGSFFAAGFSSLDKLVESSSMLIVESSVVSHGYVCFKAFLEPPEEVDRVIVDVIQKSVSRHQA